MKTIRIMAIAMLIVGSGLALLLARGQQAAGIRTHRSCHRAHGREHARRASPRNCHRRRGRADPEPAGEAPGQPGHRLPPWGASAPHRHARSAFIYAYVLSGQIRSQVDDEPARVYRSGETWFESPGAHHPVSANASDTEPARLLAVVIVDAADKQLTIPDRR